MAVIPEALGKLPAMHVLVPESYRCTLHSKRDFADVS